ncbi:hypothetical protein RNAN_1680 [Rheinheimera nanhaiensis E407-8]|uniref:Uncharacterized protein n=1 Tax=Rheinheimera nanhaiensis E407-8 TaxID=562729 RepID=I1DXB5_9GAMM|nr:hypothetical protein RNAN_1680 [Rheinheimera nanhaiensis E407-8]
MGSSNSYITHQLSPAEAKTNRLASLPILAKQGAKNAVFLPGRQRFLIKKQQRKISQCPLR